MGGLFSGVVARITVRATFGRKRALIFAIAPLLLILLTLLLKAARPRRTGPPPSSASSASRWCCRSPR